MAYFLDLFSPETYEAFSASSRRITGFRPRRRDIASRIQPGDRFICYMTRLSRWTGVLEVERGPFEDDTPIFYQEDDPFTVRFEVRPVVWLEKDKAIPIHEDEVWNRLSFTRGQDKRSKTWTGPLRGSLRQLEHGDGTLLEELLLGQAEDGKIYEVDEEAYRRMVRHRVRGLDGAVSVSVPDEFAEEEETTSPIEGTRESLQIQALVSDIGAKMGFDIWLPRNDRARVRELMPETGKRLLDRLPINYDDTTIRVIENIDVLWLRRRRIVRAFEVEHTTSIYSGILRMADLMALQPNMDISLHIIAPVERREKVFAEILRPVFSYLEKGPLAEICTFISYDSIRELSQQRHLSYITDAVLAEYSEDAE